MKIGACEVPGHGMQSYKGRVDEVSLWSDALNAQTTSASHGQLTGMEPHLRGYWQFETALPTLQVANQAVDTNAMLDLEVRLSRFDANAEYGLLFLGSSGSSVSDTVETFSNEAKLIRLEAQRLESCDLLTFAIHELPDYGLLFKAEPSSTATRPGDLISVEDALSGGLVYFEIPDRSNQDKTTSFSYSASCDGAESLEKVRVVIHVHSVQLFPHFSLANRVEYSLSTITVYDPDEVEQNSASSFALEIEGGVSPIVKLPAGVSSAAVSSGEVSSRSSVVRGSGKSSDISFVASNVKTESNRENPLSAHVRLSIDSSDESPSEAEHASKYSFQHSIGSLPVIFDIVPREIPAEGSAVELVGKNFAESSVCSLGDTTLVQATYVSPTHLQCVIPQQDRLGLVMLSVHPMGVSNDRSHTVGVIVTPSIQVLSVEPSNGIVHSGSEVVVQLSPDFNYQLCRCRVSETLVVAPHRRTFDSIACRIPFINFDGASTTIHLSVTQNLVSYVPAGDFQLVRRPRINRLYPPSGYFPVKIQEIDLFGSNFLNRSELTCSVGGSRMRGLFVSAAQVRCSLPAPANLSEPGISVEVSVNGVDFSKSGILYNQIVGSSIASVSPANGPAVGGTIIQVSGEHFSKEVLYSCRFAASRKQPAQFVDQTTLRCTTPQVDSTGPVELTVFANHVVLPHMSLAFLFTGEPTVDRIFPELGQARNATQLTILGKGFEDVGALQCAFEQGDQRWETIAERVDSTVVQCFTPGEIESGSYDVRVSLNGQDYSRRSERAQFSAHSELILHGASLPAGPSTGGSNVVISGRNFIASRYLACRFGDQVGRAVFVSNTSILCTSPAWNEKSIDRAAPIRVALNGIQFSEQSVDFQYYVPPIITKIAPSVVPVNSTVSLTVSGDYFSRQREPFCRVGTRTLEAELLESGRIKCAPTRTPTEAGTLSLGVSLNGQDYASSAHTVLVHKAIHLSRIEPSHVAHGSSSVIKVSGAGFLATDFVSCSFGPTVVKGSAVSSELMLCPLPVAQPTGKFEVAVSLNGVHFSSSSGLFVFVFPMPTFSAISPSSGVSSGGEPVTIAGAGFDTLGAALAIFCIFGEMNPVPARVMNSSSLQCTTPAAGNSLDGRDLSISFEVGKDIVRSSLLFRYITAPGFIRVRPETVIAGRRSTVILEGYGFSRARDYLVSVGEDPTAVQAQVLPNNAAIVFEFHGDDDLVDGDALPIRIAQNGVGFASTGLQLKVVHQSSTTDVVYPDSMSAEGSSTEHLTLCSESFDPRSRYLCSYASRSGSTYQAKWLTSTCLQCKVPSTAKMGKERIEVLDEATRKPARSFEVERYEAPEVSGVDPSSVQIGTQNEISVYGKGFRSDLNFSCSFNSELAALAVVHNSTWASCRLPKLFAETEVEIRVSNNLVDFTSTSAVLRTRHRMSISEVSPKYVARNTEKTILITGQNFEHGAAFCHFSTEPAAVQGHVVSDTALECPFGGSDRHGSIQLAVSAGGIAPLSNRLEIVVTEAMWVSRIYPTGGPSEGNTLISILGAGFPAYEPLFCLFDDTSVASIRLESGLLTCNAPPSKKRESKLRLSTRGRELESNTVAYTYDFEATLSLLTPTLGEVDGGTPVIFRGNGFHAMGGDLHCYFGGAQVDATFINSTAISVTTPPSPIGLGIVRVNCMENGVAMLSQGLEFRYVEGLQITSISPPMGYSSASTRVVVHGSGFAGDHRVYCHFDDISVAAQFVSGSETACVAPPHKPGAVSFSLALSGQSKRADAGKHVFEYIGSYIAPFVAVVFLLLCI